jgi:hypothetical protein
MSQAAQLLDRLQRVRPTGRGSWLARCPAHDDKTPSLSIRETNDGTVLINCFAGCGAGDVLDALGLQWNALFPPNPAARSHRSPCYSRIPARDLLEIVSQDVSIVAVVAADMLAGKPVSERDWNELSRAAARIGRARDYIR